ncbi:MAG TPA: 5'-nucleotidase C-terminal domain-containing protein [Prolixibacteraceae bacterium]|nr:5'-nucleotidase C-terminal domain-containing protein [Prolixibacteraceae bacterium]
MKRIFIYSFLFLPLSLLAQDLVIIHSNDIHSHLNGLAPESEYTPLENDNDPTRGGLSRIAGYIDEQKKRYGDRLLVLDAGDYLMGTLFQTLEMEVGFQLNLMKKMGYDYIALGNHEFDLGPGQLAGIIRRNSDRGEIPNMLSSNYLPSRLKNDSALLALFDDGTIRPYAVTTRNGYRIGIFALLGKDALESIPGKYGIRLKNNIAVARKMVRYLKNKEQVDFVIALSHSGMDHDGKGGYEGEDIQLGKWVSGIDLIISGHKHRFIDEAVPAGDALVVLPGYNGTRIGKVEVTFRPEGENERAFTPVVIDDRIPANAAIQKLIESKAASIEESLLKPIGISISKTIFETDYLLEMDETNPSPSNLGPFVADAVRFYLHDVLNEPVDVSVVATGVIRHNIDPGNTGKQNINDLFNVMPIGLGEESLPGSPLGKIFITGSELKKVFELILTVYPSMNDYYLFFSGMQIIYDPDRGLFRKISEIRVGNEQTGYKLVDFSSKDTSLYCIAANDYIIGFIGKLKKMSMGIVNISPKDASGALIENNRYLIDADPDKEGIQEAKEWLALYYYVKSFNDRNGNGIPDLPDDYRNNVNKVYVSKKKLQK